MGAVADILIGPRARTAGAQRQAGLRSIEGLNPGLLVHAQDQRVLRGLQIQADNVQQLRFEVRIGTEREGANPMGLQFRGHQDVMHRRGRQVERERSRFVQGDGLAAAFEVM